MNRAAVATWWVRAICSHFCFVCDRNTISEHTHTAAAEDRAFRRELRRQPDPRP